MRPVTQDPARGVGRRVAHDPGDPLITSHCPFCGSGQVVGRSDGTIGCDFCGQAYIVRVQPSFPGMPQPPGGPGAPSDIGPDGGLMDPSMIGPDGMPADGGMPPGDDGGEEGFPPEDDAEGGPGGEGSDSAPPPSGGSDDSKKSPKGKGGKGKKESAIYRGLQGQPLTERQFVRHLAAHASGHDPRVLAALRGESSKARFLAKMGSMRHAAETQPWRPGLGAHEDPWPDLRSSPLWYESGSRSPWDAMTTRRYKGIQEERAPRLQAVHDAVRGATGIPLSHRGPYQPRGQVPRLDTGHAVYLHLDHPRENWHATVLQPGFPGSLDNPYELSRLHLNLGERDEEVPGRVAEALSHPHVQRWLGLTGSGSEDDPWGRQRGPEEW